MTDPIKEKIKQDRTPIIVRDSMRGNLRTKRNNLPEVPSRESNIVERLYVSDPIQIYGENPGLAQLEIAVREINEGQRQLEKIRRINSSLLYKNMISTLDNVGSLFGKARTETDIYKLFTHQQQNVRRLNYILTSMVNTYSKDVKSTRNTLDDLVVTTPKEILTRHNLNKEIPVEIQRYENAVAHLVRLDKDKQPEKYYATLQEVIDNKRMSRKIRFEYVITTVGQEHHKEQINNIMLQEELFETILYRVMEMAFKTELYQQTLDHNIRIWESAHDLFKAVKIVNDGIIVLSNFNKEINNTYTKSIGDIIQIVDSHPGRKLINATNRDLRQLVADVNASSYRDAIESYTNN